MPEHSMDSSSAPTTQAKDAAERPEPPWMQAICDLSERFNSVDDSFFRRTYKRIRKFLRQQDGEVATKTPTK